MAPLPPSTECLDPEYRPKTDPDHPAKVSVRPDGRLPTPVLTQSVEVGLIFLAIRDKK
ncbi:MAG: hypothetical protein ACYCOO_05720 [Chitinophagaceae bacterium]